MFLSLPDVQYEASFLAMQDEITQAGGTHTYQADLNDKSFAEYVALLKDHSEGRNLPEGFVPYTEYWLINDDKEVIGKASLRHELNETLATVGGHVGYEIRPSQRGKGYGTLLLHLLLEKAQERGMDRLLITCNYDNLPSKKIIEANGGIFEKKVPHTGEPGQKDKLRYWVTL